jgi:hydroxyethylthiazole kinase-like uncharacterized protein yjeF
MTAAQMREIDRLTVEQYAIPSLLLMEAAAGATFGVISQAFSEGLAGKKARILCGRGNNGGDGAALALALARAGAHADVVLFGRVEDARGDARANLETVRRLAGFDAGSSSLPSPLAFVECDSESAWQDLAGPGRTYDILVDALFGTGLTRPLEGIHLQVVQHLALIRRARERAAGERPLIVSIDLPSGLNADSAEIIGPAVDADVTVTFTAPKPANVLPPACHYGGRLVVARIGSPDVLLDRAGSKLFLVEEEDTRAWLKRTRYTAASYKKTHGHVLVIAGSRDYSGAASLCGNAAMRSGAGLVTIATPASAQSSVAGRAMPEVMTTALAETDRGAVSDEAIEHVLQLQRKASVIAIGPGLGSEDDRTRRFVRAIVERRTTAVVIDADGLNCLAPWPETLSGSTEAPLILTPHIGEMMRLLAEGRGSAAGSNEPILLADRVSAARDFATAHEVIVLLKGSRSLVAAPDGRVFINPTGNAGLGTAGAGDTLTGLVASFVAQAVGIRSGSELVAELDSVIAALYIGGLAGDLAANEFGMRTMVASDIRNYFSAAIRSLDHAGEMPDKRS